MIPAPYIDGTEALVTGSHEQRVLLTLTAGEVSWTMTLLSGDLTLSEDWSPRGQFTAVVPNVFTLAELAAIDPRTGTIAAVVTAGYVHPDGTVDMHPVFTGHLRERRVVRPGNLVHLQAWSGEGLAQDAGWLEIDEFKSFGGVTEALEWFASYATGETITMTSSVGLAYRADLTGSIPTPPGTSVWDFMSDLALAADVRLYVDPDGGWTIADKATAADPDATSLASSSGSEDVLSRNGYYSAAVLTYSWRDAMDVDHTITGRYGSLPGRVFTVRYATAMTQGQADAAAQATVANLSTRGDSYVCTDVAKYWLRPASTVNVALASGTDVDHLVKAVTFHLVNGTMTTTTREPSNLGDE